MSEDRRVAFVTGAARGIGMAVARLFLKNDCDVVIADLKIDEAIATSRELDPSGEHTLALELDVTRTISVDSAIGATVARFGQLDVLVNNAGNFKPEPSETVTDEAWSSVLGVHLEGTFHCCRAAYAALCESSTAAIVNTSSILARVGMPNRVSYIAAKAGIEGLTYALAVEWAKEGIRVNAVAPGWTRTKRVDEFITSGILDESSLTGLIPMRRFGQPKEIASAVYWLASPDASYVTGHVLFVDGGFLVGSHA